MNGKHASLVATIVLMAAAATLLVRHALVATHPALMALQVLAVLLMIWARITFGARSFHAAANPTEGGLVTTGPYRWIRHPIYAAIVVFLGVGVVSHPSLVNVLVGIVAYAATAVRIMAEERLVTERYPEYAAYAARTKRIIPFVLVAAFVVVPALAGEPDYAKLFAGRDGCFELYDLKANKRVVRYNPRRCVEATSPCSTFKVPLALMAFDTGILADETSSIVWDGTTYERESWNHDQTAASWMQNSVVWFSQRLTPQLGLEKVKAYLGAFDFGNRDTSGGLTHFWLESSLTISPDDAMRFWQRFWKEELPVCRHAFDMTKKITFIETSPAGWTLHGKTGSGAAGVGTPDRKLGWFVGHVARGDREYVFAARYTDRVTSADSRPSGWIARDIAKTILHELGLY